MNNDSFNIQETMSRLKIMSQHGCLSFEQDIRILMHHLCDMLPMIQVLQKNLPVFAKIKKNSKLRSEQVYTLTPNCAYILNVESDVDLSLVQVFFV